MNKTDELKAALAAKGLRYVATRGNTSAPICLVGEAPGADEDQSGKPFVGASGRELDRMLTDGGCSELDCWFTNPYKTRPPDNKLDRLSELGVPNDLFLDQFFEELSTYRPTLIVALGATPLGLLCPDTVSHKTGKAEIGKWRGSLLRSPKLPWSHYVVPCHHPAYILREWSERQIAVLCLAKVAEEFEFLKQHRQLQELPQRQLITLPGASDVLDFLRASVECKAVSIDIEMIRGRFPYTIAVAQNEKLAISFSLADYEKVQLTKIWRALDLLMRKTPKIIGQNWIGFDQLWLEHIGFLPEIKVTDDTMIRQHVLWPELERSLAFMCMQYTRQPYYKDDGRKWTLKDGPVQLQRYNAMDAAVTYEVWLRQEEEFNDRSRDCK